MTSHQSRELIRDGDSRTISVAVPNIAAMSPKLRATWPLGRGPSIAGHSIPLAARATPAASHGRDCHTGWGASQCVRDFCYFALPGPYPPRLTTARSSNSDPVRGEENPQARRPRIYQTQWFHSPLPVSSCHFPPLFSSALNSPPLRSSPQ
jgi:hypothetical protein